MKKYRWQIIILCLTGLVVGLLLLFEAPREDFSIIHPLKLRREVFTPKHLSVLSNVEPIYSIVQMMLIMM